LAFPGPTQGFCIMPLNNVPVPTSVRTLTALSGVLDRAAAQAEGRKIEPATLLNARLYPDMFTFTRQVQNACDFAAKTTARLAGGGLADYSHNEASFGERKERIAGVLEYVAGVDGAQGNRGDATRLQVAVGGPH